MQTKLYRSPTDKMIGGVCGGLGAYLAIDPVLIRLFFVLLTLGGGSGIVIYMIMWILIPYPDQNLAASAETIKAGAEEIAARGRALGADMRVTLQGDNPQAGLIIGAALVLLGLVFLGQSLRIAWLSWLDFGVLWPMLLIAGGVTLIWRRVKGVPS
jgi:phage shock protein PspC (stress-responsive transcriptional regulator)